MLKSLFSLVEGGTNRAVPATAKGTAPIPRNPKVLKCAEAVGWAQKALVIAVAQNREQRAQADKFSAHIAELEARAVLALGAGSETEALDAAEVIAALEPMRDRLSETLSGFAEEFARLRQMLQFAKLQLNHLRDGSGAREGDSAVWWRRDHGSPNAGESNRDLFSETETALARLHGRQVEIDRANAVLRGVDPQMDPKAEAPMMIDAAFGEPRQKKARYILERLRSK